MKAICVDDEELILNMTVKLCRGIPRLDEVRGFSDALEAMEYVKTNPIDVALLDIDMPEMNGIEMARNIKNCRPDTSIIFVTGYANHAVEAFGLHASGYLLKPINKEKLIKEVDYALLIKSLKSEPADESDSSNGESGAGEGNGNSGISVRTFGEFDMFVDGEVVTFKRAKSKELLAYLIDREGGSVSRAALFAALWEEDAYDRKSQKQLDVIIRSLRETLKSYGISDLLVVEKGLLRIVPEMLDCDLYRFLAGDIEAVNRYRGEYMNQYSWGTITEGLITAQLN